MIPLLEGFSRINAKSTAGAFLAELELAPSARLPVEAAVYGFACFFFEVFFGAATAGAPSTDTRRSARLERRGAALTAALAAYVATTSGDYLNPLRWTPCCRCPNRRLHSLWPSPPRWKQFDRCSNQRLPRSSLTPPPPSRSCRQIGTGIGSTFLR